MTENVGSAPSCSAPSKKGVFEYLELSVSFIKALAWPLVVGIMLVMWGDPLTRVVDTLPSLVSKTRKLTIANVALDIGRNTTAPPEVERVLKDISPRALVLLIDSHPNPEGAMLWDEFVEPHKDAYAELERKKILSVKRLRADDTDALGNVEVVMTDLGRKSRTFALDVIVDQLTTSEANGAD